MNYVIKHRLRWEPSPQSTPQTGPLFEFEDPIPFADSRDFKIMPNDWPYGLDVGIRHIIVWLKNKLDTEPTRGDLTQASRAQVEEFIQQQFVKPLKHLPQTRERVMWFKNWVCFQKTYLFVSITDRYQTSLQSVPGIDHVHVLVRDIPDHLISSWTDGEVPMQAMINGV